MKIWDKNKTSYPSFSNALGIKEGDVIQIAGSGGKTTLSYAIAKENAHLKAAILTTTKRFAPTENSYILAENEVLDISKIKGSFVEVGVLDGKGKIGWIGNDNYETLKAWAELIIIESDGSKRLPIKAASYYEPIFVPDATHTLIVCGLSAIGRRMGDVCHRFQLVADRFNPDTIVTEDEMLYLLTTYYKNRYESLNPVFIANQADDNILFEIGIKIASKLNGFVCELKPWTPPTPCKGRLSLDPIRETSFP